LARSHHLGCTELIRASNLPTGPAFFPAIGGVHPGRVTRNSLLLLPLGERRYLEIIAPYPAHLKLRHFPQIRSIPTRPHWLAVHPPDIRLLASSSGKTNVEFTGPCDGSRKASGLRASSTGKTINLADDHHGLLRLFIDVAPTRSPPSKDAKTAPARCNLGIFRNSQSRSRIELTSTLKRMGINVPVQRQR